MTTKLFLLLLCMSAILLTTNAGEEDEYDEEEKTTTAKLTDSKINVGIIGGGIAGLTAFRRLQAAGLKNVELFEASDRLGGRVFPVPFEDGYLQLGAEYIESQGNPLFDLAEKLKLVNDSWELSAESIFDNAVFKTGKCTPNEDQVEEFKKFATEVENKLYELAEEEDNWAKTIGDIYKEKLEQYIKSKKRSASEIKLINALSKFYENYYSSDWNAPIDKISLKNLDTYDPLTNNKSTIVLNKLGYKAILDDLTKDLPHEQIHFSSRVTLVDFSGDKTRLKINDNKFYSKEFDYVIVTVPLGYLKAHVKEMFKPQLPQQKLDVIDALGFGSLHKAFFIYEKAFWAEDGYESVIVPLQVEDCVEPNELNEALLSVDVVQWKPNVLLAWVSGDAVKVVDGLSDQELISKVTKHFKATMTDVTPTEPKKVIRKSWTKDENFLGSYSYMTPASTRYSDPFKVLSKPVFDKQRPKILFAGEATHSQIYQTTAGAFLSGEREAGRVIKFAQKYSK